MKDGCKHLAYLGETHVALELAKRKFKVLKAEGFAFDFLGENHCKLEVKAALPSISKSYKDEVAKLYEYRYWQFRLTVPGQRNCDFFVCVPFESLDKPPLGYFVFPNSAVTTLGKSDLLCVYPTDLSGEFKRVNKTNKIQYLDNWAQILKFGESNTQDEVKEEPADQQAEPAHE